MIPLSFPAPWFSIHSLCITDWFQTIFIFPIACSVAVSFPTHLLSISGFVLRSSSLNFIAPSFSKALKAIWFLFIFSSLSSSVLPPGPIETCFNALFSTNHNLFLSTAHLVTRFPFLKWGFCFKCLWAFRDCRSPFWRRSRWRNFRFYWTLWCWRFRQSCTFVVREWFCWGLCYGVHGNLWNWECSCQSTLLQFVLCVTLESESYL